MRVIFAGDAQGRSNYESGMKGAISVAGLKEVASIVGHLRDMPRWRSRRRISRCFR
ncbi:MAG: hypothetical protein NVV62_12835 [Terricaulis sp.]|nr:hypothetical protein [Terricaulis sp.]